VSRDASPAFYPPTYPRRAAVLLELLKTHSRTGKIPEAKKLAQSQAAKASQLDEEQSRAACKRCQSTTNNNKTTTKWALRLLLKQVPRYLPKR
jgi:hypothetical protein